MQNNLKIILPFDGILKFITEVKNPQNTNLADLWLELAVAPYWSQWAAGQFNEDRTRNELQFRATEITDLERAVDILGASGVSEQIDNAFQKIIELLPPYEQNITVCIYPNLHLDATVHGVVGFCAGDNILLQINPFIPGWEQYIPWVLAHEYNHSIFGYIYYYLKGNRSPSILTSIICEGEADSFAKLICPELSPFWVRALTPDEELQQWAVMKTFLESEDNDALHIRFFFGDSHTATPQYTGYTIGFNIIQQYLKNHPVKGVLDLMEMEPTEILKLSEYGL